MLTTGEQRELRLIEEELQNTDRRFTRRLTLVQGLLRWAAPGRQARLLKPLPPQHRWRVENNFGLKFHLTRKFAA